MTREIETLDAFDAAAAAGDLPGAAVQDLDLTARDDVLATTDVRGTLFLGCTLTIRGTRSVVRRGGLAFPRVPDVPFNAYRARLYEASELYHGLSRGYAHTPDGTIYRWSQDAASTQLSGTLARALHDHSIGDALAEWVPAGAAGVGIMGGHATQRGSDAYLTTARLAHALADAGRLVVTGGGPGAMEAGNLGASLPGSDADVQSACARLAAVPTFADGIEAWASLALDVKRDFGCARTTLGVPTWFYGHEPPNVFGTGIAKYFDNALREDALLRLGTAGIVVMPGAAGTVQEIFQALTPNYYARAITDVHDLVLVGRDYWTHDFPAWPLLESLSRGRLNDGQIHLVDAPEDALEILLDQKA